MKKRLLCLLLALCMAMCILPVAANAAVLPGGGTEENPYTVSNLNELKALRDSVNAGNKYSGAYIRLLADINLGGSDSPWTPIGIDNYNGFLGNFDGCNHKIKGLYIDTGKNLGLFGFIGGSIKNLEVEGSVSGSYNIGGIAADNNGEIESCVSRVNVNSTFDGGGGIVGTNSSGGTISGCISTGRIIGDVDVGGIAGINNGVIKDCGNVGDVSGSGTVGGIVGLENGSDVGSTTRCYTVGNVSGGDFTGAIYGMEPLGIYDWERVTGCIALDTVSASFRTKASAEAFKDKNTFINLGWDFENVWAMDESAGYPVPKAVYEMISFLPETGKTYYFDLSEFEIPGELNTALPDSTLHYVPFTYGGAVNSYSVTDETHLTDELAEEKRKDRLLFIAEYNVTKNVSWSALASEGFAFGNDISAYGGDYVLRMPTAGSYKKFGNDDGIEAGLPIFNEWDALIENGVEIKNFYKEPSWGQETGIISYLGIRRAWITQREWNCENKTSADGNYRPVIEVKNSASVGVNGLKAITLDLSGGTLDGKSEISIVAKKGATFTAPASEGLTPPKSHVSKGLKWLGSDGVLYTPGESVPSSVFALKAIWPYYEQFTLEVGGTYYFDLTSLDLDGFKKNINTALPDTTLHYTPFVYAGTTDASKYEHEDYYHSLFIAENNIFTGVSFKDLHFAGDQNFIYGNDYRLNNILYLLRAPSVGKNGDLQNEWDKLLNKGDFIKNCGSLGSLGQEALDESDLSPGEQAVFGGTGSVIRGADSKDSREYVTTDSAHGYRPVLEVSPYQNLPEDGLKAVTLDLNGGSLGENTVIKTVVQNNTYFPAPTGEGLTAPDGFNASALMWLGSDGEFYAPGDTVPSGVTSLKAQWCHSDALFEWIENDGVITIVKCNATGESVTVPSSIGGVPVKAIASKAFSGENGVYSVIISEGIETLCENAFWNYRSLRTLYVPSTAKNIHENMLADKSGFKFICRAGSNAHKYAKQHNCDYTTVSDFTLSLNAEFSDVYSMTVIAALETKGDLNRIMTCGSSDVIEKKPSYKSGETEIFGTGSRIASTYEEYGTAEYTIVVLGDLNGDGVCDVLDASVAESYLSKKSFGGNAAAELAATSGRGGEMTVEDYSNLVNTALKTE